MYRIEIIVFKYFGTGSNYWLYLVWGGENLSIANAYRWGEWLTHPNNLGEDKWHRGINSLLNILKHSLYLSGIEISSVLQGVWTMDCFGKAYKQASASLA